MSHSIRVLIVEDESLIRWSLRQKLQEQSYEVSEAEDGKSALRLLESPETGGFDVILLDFKLPDTTGLEILRRLRALDHDAVVIMLTAYSTLERAVEAVKLGAYDYLAKPFQMDHLLLVVSKALETTRLRREVRELRRTLREQFGTDTIIGKHPATRQLLDVIQRIARSGASTVFLRGETGTGKDLVARVIHHASDRAAKPFINVTCTALSETLLESELFGHERGAFTDAKSQKKGLLELADGGTVFLDEIGDMPPALQAKLLRFLEERRFRRVGGTHEIAVDVRIIAATNRDIEQAIAEGKFRRDLLYRLNVVTVLLCREDAIGPEDIVLGRDQPSGWLADLQHCRLPVEGFNLEKLEQLELHLIRQALARTRNNQTQAGKLLNLSRDQLRYRLQKHGVILEDLSEEEPGEQSARS
jgi:two-component system response regulator AtoC